MCPTDSELGQATGFHRNDVRQLQPDCESLWRGLTAAHVHWRCLSRSRRAAPRLKAMGSVQGHVGHVANHLPPLPATVACRHRQNPVPFPISGPLRPFPPRSPQEPLGRLPLFTPFRPVSPCHPRVPSPGVRDRLTDFKPAGSAEFRNGTDTAVPPSPPRSRPRPTEPPIPVAKRGLFGPVGWQARRIQGPGADGPASPRLRRSFCSAPDESVLARICRQAC